MKIKTLSINDIHPYENNPRQNDYAVEKVAESIKRYGFRVPVVIDKNNVIVTGHTRVKACELLGIKEVPCVIADDLSDEQIKEFRLVDNKVAEYATWDYSLLNIELADLGDLTEFDFPDFSIQDDPTQEELDVLLEDSIQTSPNRNRDRPKVEDPSVPQSVIEEPLPSEEKFEMRAVEIVCNNPKEERELFDFLNSHGYIYEIKDLF